MIKCAGDDKLGNREGRGGGGSGEGAGPERETTERLAWPVEEAGETPGRQRV